MRTLLAMEVDPANAAENLSGGGNFSHASGAGAENSHAPGSFHKVGPSGAGNPQGEPPDNPLLLAADDAELLAWARGLPGHLSAEEPGSTHPRDDSEAFELPDDLHDGHTRPLQLLPVPMHCESDPDLLDRPSLQQAWGTLRLPAAPAASDGHSAHFLFATFHQVS
jgi:hypothetical protein